MSSEPLAPGAPAIILYRQVDRDDNDSSTHQDNYFRIKILTEEGRKHADIEIPFFEGNEDIVNLKGRSIKPDGTIVTYEGKVFEKQIVKVRGAKYLAKTFTLPDVQVGSIIEYFYTSRFAQERVFDSHWILSDELFTKKAQFSLKAYKDPYRAVSLRWSWQSLPAGTVPPKEGEDHIIRMEANNIPAFQTEDYMPPANELRSRVDFIYAEGFADKDAESYWKRIGYAWNSQLEEFLGKPKSMEKAVAQIVSPADSQEVKLRKIYDRVQQVRNTTFELAKTAQEEKRQKVKVAEKAEDVWKRGYGGGADLTWLFLALVRAAGFEAYGCWVSDRREYFFNPATMQGSKLNTNVVLVKLGGKDLYLDPGVVFTPFGLLTWSETGVQGLRLDKDGGSWIQTTLPQASESRIERTGKLTLNEAGDLEGKLTVTYTGLAAMTRRIDERNTDQVARKKSLEEMVTGQIGVPAEAELTNQPDWTTTGAPLVAEFNLKIANWASNAGKRMVLPAAIFTAGEKGVFEHANREHPVYFNYPHEKADNLTIDLPSGWQVSSVPPPQERNGKVIVYSLNVEQAPGTLRLKRKFTIDMLLLDTKYYAQLRNFYQVVRNDDALQIVVQPGEVHARN